jgi:YgiT-type zinc finger domain-containing protein
MKERICSCGETMITKKTTVERKIGSKKITIKNVPVLYCNNCKEILYNARTVKIMDKIIHDNPGENEFDFYDPIDSVGKYLDTLKSSIASTGMESYLLADPDKPISYADLIYLSKKMHKNIA